MFYLVMQLYGPLAAWGKQAIGETRRSDSHPSKSAVLGLCAAAMGVDRDDEAEHLRLNDDYRYATQVISAGEYLQDYHTTQVPSATKDTKHCYTRKDELNTKKLNTILSTREYRQDALALVMLWQADGKNQRLKGLKNHLQFPEFHLYLGRKACPLALPLNPMPIEASSVQEAFSAYPADSKIVTHLTDQPSTIYWEACEHSGMDGADDMQSIRHDNLLSRKRWQYAPRTEYRKILSGESK